MAQIFADRKRGKHLFLSLVICENLRHLRTNPDFGRRSIPRKIRHALRDALADALARGPVALAPSALDRRGDPAGTSFPPRPFLLVCCHS